jgi:hypothetical protein
MSTISCWDGEMVDPSRLGLNTKKGVEVQVCTSSPEFVEGHEKCAHQERLAHDKCLQSKRLGSDPDALAVWDTSSRHLEVFTLQ